MRKRLKIVKLNTCVQFARHAMAAMLALAAALLFAPAAQAYTCKAGWACNNPPSGCLNNAGCVPCPKGTFGLTPSVATALTDQNTDVCLPCPPGSISDDLAQTKCKLCSYAGHEGYVASADRTKCLPLIKPPPGVLGTGGGNKPRPPGGGILDTTSGPGTAGPAGAGSPLGGARPGAAGAR